MHPIIWLALVGASFWAGRQSSKPAPVPADRPLPPLPPPPGREALTGPPKDYSAAWAGVEYPVDIFPPEAEPRVEHLMPPPSPDGVSVAPGCHAIALGQGWWDRAGEIAAAAKYQQKLSDPRVVDAVLRAAAPTCRRSSSLAISGLRMELVAMVREMPPQEQARNYETTVTR